MAKLILSMDGLVLKEIPLVKGRTTIGRKPDNDIQIDNLAISGEHAAIVTILNDSFLEDLDSTNGTYVNGQPIKKHFLHFGDIIELGKYRLKYLAEATTKDLATEYEKPLSISPEGSTGGQAEPDSQRLASATKSGGTAGGDQGKASNGGGSAKSGPQTETVVDPAPEVAAPVGTLKVLNGVNAGRRLDLTKTLTTLGKPGVQVAVITRRPQGYYLTHVEGAQLPLVNGQSTNAQAYPLQDHDVIDLAGVRMEFSRSA
jgi:pSer/pThr/pTyr-binding forkhead associated (FHA) protein